MTTSIQKIVWVHHGFALIASKTHDIESRRFEIYDVYIWFHKSNFDIVQSLNLFDRKTGVNTGCPKKPATPLKMVSICRYTRVVPVNRRLFLITLFSDVSEN